MFSFETTFRPPKPDFRVRMDETKELQGKNNKYEDALFLIESGEFKDIAYKYTKILHKDGVLNYEVIIDDVFETKLNKMDLDKFKYVIEVILKDLLMEKSYEEMVAHYYNRIYNY
jgi:hypothetical protein